MNLLSRARLFPCLLPFLLAAVEGNDCEDRAVTVTKSLEIGDEIVLTAKDVCDYSGVVIDESVNGTGTIGWINFGDYFKYGFDLNLGGIFDMCIHVSSPEGGGSFEFSNTKGNEVLKVVPFIPRTGDWKEYVTINLGAVYIQSGLSIFQLFVLRDGWNLESISFKLMAPATEMALDKFYGGRFVYAEKDYMNRGFDFTSLPEGVVVSPIDEYDSSLAFLSGGDFLKFDLDVIETGLFKLYVCVANPSQMGSFVITGQADNVFYTEVEELPATDDWGEWAEFEVGEFELEAGSYALQAYLLEGGFDLMFFGVDYVGETNVTGSRSYYIPYSITETVDMIASRGVSLDGNMIGQLDANDFIIFNLEVPFEGVFTVEFMVASPAGQGVFLLFNADTNGLLGGSTPLPVSTDWWTGKKAEVPGVALPAGPVRLKMEIHQWGFNLLSLALRMT